MKINEYGTLTFDEEECLDLERLAATGHSLKEMALYFGVSYNLFKKENPSVEDLKNLFALDIDYK